MHNLPLLPFQVGETCAERYRIERVLGRGGMGVVYAAVHCFTGGRVALKVLYEPQSDLPERMEQEARALAAIHHRHVVRVLDGGTTERGVVWFAMELLEGRSLRERLQQAGRLPLTRALKYAREIAAGVAAAHAAGIVHRDLKPENVFVVEPEDEIRVLDFGTAKFRRGSLKTTDRMRVLGTYAYMAPERLQGNAGDPRSDIYSLGHVLYELCAGRHAFSEGPGPLDLPPTYELGLRQMLSRPRSLSRLCSAVPAPLVELVDGMLEKHPDDRPSSLAAVVDALDQVANGPLEHAPAAPPPGPGAPATGSCGTEPLSPRASTAAEPLIDDAAALVAALGVAPTEAALAPPPAANARAATHRDLLEQLRPGEYPACRSFSAQAMLGAVRFATRGGGPRDTERDLAAVLAASPAEPQRVEDAAIAMTVLARPERARMRALLREWAGAIDPEAAAGARERVELLVAQARAQSADAFLDDALRTTRVLAGASVLPARHERDPSVAEVLLRLASGSLEDLQLAHFGLLLLTRFDDAQQNRIRDALHDLGTGSEAARDAARAWLGHLLAESVRPEALATARPRTRPSAAPISRPRGANGPTSTPESALSAAAGVRQLRSPAPLLRAVWAAPIDIRWVPLILAGALCLGALMSVVSTGARPASPPSPDGNTGPTAEGEAP